MLPPHDVASAFLIGNYIFNHLGYFMFSFTEIKRLILFQLSRLKSCGRTQNHKILILQNLHTHTHIYINYIYCIYVCINCIFYQIIYVLCMHVLYTYTLNSQHRPIPHVSASYSASLWSVRGQ